MGIKLKALLGKKNNDKGFSLVELLIVIAIMGVLAVIAFNAFSGVLVNSKKKADDQQAKNIENSLRTFVTDTGIIDPVNNGPKLFTAPAPAVTVHTMTVGIATASVNDLLVMLMKPTYVADKLSATRRACGPYLHTSTVGTFLPTQFDPQWMADAGGTYTGWVVTVTKSTNGVNVAPNSVGGPAVTSVYTVLP